MFVIWPDGVTHLQVPFHIPSLSVGMWNGLPLGSLKAWLVAYRLMDRPIKPDRIHEYLAAADRDRLERMLAEPLPLPIRLELKRLR